MNKSLLSSKRDSWNTPKEVLDRVRELGEIDLDPCSNEDSIVGATAQYVGSGGLDIDWTDDMGDGLAYVNPPYGREIGRWVQRCALFGTTYAREVVALLPARPDTKWFTDAWTANALCFWRGRLRFLGAPSSAPFPSVVAYWGRHKYRFADIFDEVGHVVFP